MEQPVLDPVGLNLPQVCPGLGNEEILAVRLRRVMLTRSRRHHTEQLALRGRELEAERELFAAQAVR